jgi:hypothetical protein
MRVLPLVILLLLAQPALADERAKLSGTWKLVTWVLEDTQTGERKPAAFGERPTGYVIFTPEGRLFALITATGRSAPQSIEDQSTAYRTMIAYTGKYRLEGSRFITKVDAAWNEGWIGTEQDRVYRLVGDKLYIESPPVSQDGRSFRGILEWERER